MQDRTRHYRMFFVAGPPKCGTTWVQQTIDSHPDTAVGGETNLAPELLFDMVNLMTRFARTRKAAIPDHPEHPPLLTPDDAVRILRETADTVFDRFADLAERRDGRRHALIGDKSPGHTRHIHLLARIYPEARFVCCVRDVRDAAVSAYMHFIRKGAAPDFFGPGATLQQAAELYARNHWAEMLRFARAAGQRLGPDRYLEVHYEHYQAAPHDTVRAVLDFLGLDACDERVDACVHANRFETRTGRTPGHEENRFERKGIVGDWANHFTPEFGDHLLRIAEERLALGEQIVPNTPTITWRGGPALRAA